MKLQRNDSGLPTSVSACMRNLFLLLLGLLVIACQQGLEKTGPQKAAPSAPEGSLLFNEKCSKCHELGRALLVSGDRQTWLATIERMRDQHKADINTGEIDKLVRFHVERQQREKIIFAEKCQICHSGKRFVEKALTPEQIREVIAQMQAKAGNTITDQDVELIINYHVREHRRALENNLRTVFGLQEESMEGGAFILFLEKCSSCHEPDRAFEVFKDVRMWNETVARMQNYSDGVISDAEAARLIEFHVQEQQKEIETFRTTCTVCHSDERINRQSMSAAQWEATVQRMRQKMPQLITEEKIGVLARYHHRREMVLASLFEERCSLCHPATEDKKVAQSPSALAMIIEKAEKNFGGVLAPPDITSLLGSHASREESKMSLFEENCVNCHGEDELKSQVLPMEQWFLRIAILEGTALTEVERDAIRTRIHFHVSRN